MANTCAGYDGSAPDDVLEAIRRHIRKDKKDHGANSRWAKRKDLEEVTACLVWDLGGRPDDVAECKHDANECCLRKDGKKVKLNKPPTPIG